MKCIGRIAGRIREEHSEAEPLPKASSGQQLLFIILPCAEESAVDPRLHSWAINRIARIPMA